MANFGVYPLCAKVGISALGPLNSPPTPPYQAHKLSLAPLVYDSVKKGNKWSKTLRKCLNKIDLCFRLVATNSDSIEISAHLPSTVRSQIYAQNYHTKG